MSKYRGVLLGVLCICIVPGPSSAQSAANADFDGSGIVDLTDFLLLAEAFNGTNPVYDLDGNGVGDFPDFLLLVDVFGQTVAANRAPLADAGPDQGVEKELIDFCAGSLAEYQRPSSVELIDSLPPNAMGRC